MRLSILNLRIICLAWLISWIALLSLWWVITSTWSYESWGMETLVRCCLRWASIIAASIIEMIVLDMVCFVRIVVIAGILIILQLLSILRLWSIIRWRCILVIVFIILQIWLISEWWWSFLILSWLLNWDMFVWASCRRYWFLKILEVLVLFQVLIWCNIRLSCLFVRANRSFNLKSRF